MTDSDNLIAGARNLLVNCLDLKPDETLVIIHEKPDLGWYDKSVPMTIAEEARKMGVEPTMLEVGAPGNERDQNVTDAINEHSCTIFFARVGDQDRFADPLPGKKCVMCYARDADMLASRYGRTTYQAMVQLKEAINVLLLGAENIEITCPLGTKFSGSAPDRQRAEPRDVAFKRFPLGVPMPIEASEFSGKVALARYLTPTGSKMYSPPNLQLDEVVFATVRAGKILKFDGRQDIIDLIQAHYKKVSEEFDIDSTIMHSWHPGIHAGCQYKMNASDDPDRWSNTAFTNPRILHFHTCGDYGPGEICWMAIDHTVSVDGTNLWENGRLMPEAFEQTRKCLDNWPELVDLFAHPAAQIGL
jgi:hypothetical protein